MAENRERIADWLKRYESKAARRTEAMSTSLPATLRSAGDALRHITLCATSTKARTPATSKRGRLSSQRVQPGDRLGRFLSAAQRGGAEFTNVYFVAGSPVGCCRTVSVTKLAEDQGTSRPASAARANAQGMHREWETTATPPNTLH